LRYFRLIGGEYQEQPVATSNPRVWIEDLEIGLAVWQGIFEGMPKSWLRWCDADGTLLLTDTEAAVQQQQQTELKLRQTILNLHEMGMAFGFAVSQRIAQIAQITGSSEREVEAIVQQ
jgi:hypothetical protein